MKKTKKQKKIIREKGKKILEDIILNLGILFFTAVLCGAIYVLYLMWTYRW